MALFGACGFGAVTGWLGVLIVRPALAVAGGLGWRIVMFVLAGGGCACALVWLYLGMMGIQMAALGLGLGAVVAIAVIGGRARPAW